MTAGVLFVLYIVGFMVAIVPAGWADAIGFISFLTPYHSFARGLIDTRAVIYFLSVAILCLLVSFRSLESRKWS